ncbi:DUF11 domain-containing protein [Cereibacter changlensis]|uniref:DUF11 domain-containing protein n=1 Tax=Cereibacter changlensis TaxID=402884 RepID=A0A4U0Z1P7_9RHOB|nr:SdrD B-like domain-containing protein [Cereibacter changlensis]TKA97199.1 DUF11 domain-containing protein [Cereibacter changlensis]
MSTPVFSQTFAYDRIVNISNLGSGAVPAGGLARYAVKVTNDSEGTSPATSLRIPVPAGFSFAAASGSITGCAETAGVVVCEVPALAGEAIAELNIDFTTSVQGVITLTPTLPENDANNANNAETVTTTITRGSDVALSLTGTATARSGSRASYSFVATNNGPYPSDGFILDVPVPTGLVEITAPTGCSLSASVYVCAVTTPVAADATVAFLFSGTVSAGADSTITLSGGLRDAMPGDPFAGNNTAQFNTAVTPGSDLKLAKSRSPAGTLQLGDTATFTLSPSYTGDVPTGLTLVDEFPDGYLPLSALGNGWTCDISGQTVRCEKPAGTAVGANVSLGQITVTAEAVEAGQLSNSARIEAAAPFDPDPSNNSADDGGTSIVLPSVDMAAFKQAPQPALALVGESYDYRLGATNVGRSSYFGTVVIEDRLPEGMEATGYSGSGWFCDPLPATGPATVTCETFYTSAAPLLPNGRTPDIVMSTTILQDGRLSNAAHVSVIDGNLEDNNPANDTVQVDIASSAAASSADIRVLKSAAKASVPAGEEQVFTLQIVNDGPSTATDVVLTDQLTSLINARTGPTGAGYVGTTQSPGAASGLSCSASDSGPRSVLQTCDIATLPVCTVDVDCPVVTITVRPGASSVSRSNTATASSSTTVDPDYLNNTAVARYAVEPRADVALTKTAASSIPAGQELIFVLTAENLDNGLSSAANVTVTDVLRPGLTFVSASPSTGSCSSTPQAGTATEAGNDTLVCNLGTIGNGKQQTVSVTVRPNQVHTNTTLTNEASVSTSTVEIDTTNNTALSSTEVTAPSYDLRITKSESVDPVTIGDDMDYLLFVINDGASATEAVKMVFTLPAAGLGYRSVIAPADGRCDDSDATLDAPGGSITCSFDYLPADEQRLVKVTMRGVAKGASTSAASVSALGSGTFDIKPDNNLSSETTTIRTRVDLGLTKVAGNSEPGLGEAFDFEISLVNRVGAGLTEADGVVLTDALPAGMVLTGPPAVTLVSGTASLQSCTGTAGEAGFSCSFGTLSSGAELDITAPVRVTTISASPQSFTNSAKVETQSRDIDAVNNSAAASVSVSASSLTGRVFRDFNDNGLVDPLDTGIAGVALSLSGEDAGGLAVSASAMTAADGSYSFGLLPVGRYSIIRGTLSEDYLSAGEARPGSAGGAAAAAEISGIELPGGTDATDYLFPNVPQARVGIVKQVSEPATLLADGSFTLGFTLLVQNLSDEPLEAITVTDALSGAAPGFGDHSDSGSLAPGSYRITSTSGSCGVSAGFNGDSDPVLVSGATLEPAASCTVQLGLQVQPTAPLPPEISTGARYSNQAVVTAKGAWSGQTEAGNAQLRDLSDNAGAVDTDGNGQANETSENAPTPVPLAFTPGIALIKTADASALTDPKPGDLITYGFTVRNTGNVTLTDVTLTDALPGIVLSGGPIASLAPGADDSTSFTATYALTAADLAAGEVSNSAEATAIWGVDSAGDPLTVSDRSGTTAANDRPTKVSIAAIELVKTADLSGLSTPPAVGDIVTYSFAITNDSTGALRNIVLTDPMPGLELTGEPIASLAAGETDSTTYTGRYEVTQADLDAGRIENTATVTGEHASDGADGWVRVADSASASALLPGAPALTLIKTADVSELSSPAKVGEPISYGFTIVNTGNVTLTGITLTDALADLEITGGPIASLAAGVEDSTTFTARYRLKQSDFDAGRVENTATVRVTYTDPVSGVPREVTDVSGSTATTDDPTVVLLDQAPAIALVKTADASRVHSPAQVGDEIRYSFAITNTGNVTLTDVSLSDTLPDLLLTGGPIDSLAPGQSDTTSFSATYALVQADLDAGRVTNQATVTGGYSDGDGKPQTVSDVSGSAVDKDDPTAVPLAQEAGIALVKTADASDVGSPAEVGDEIRYSFAITNTGSVTLTDITLADPLPGLVLTGGPIASLSPGATATSFSATYKLTQADLDAGGVENLATATGSYTDGAGGPETVSDDSGNDVGDDDPTVVPLDQAASITLVKTADVSGLGSPAKVGDKIVYSFVVTNTGSVTLMDVTLEDPLPGVVLTGGRIASLAPGASDSTSFRATYALTQADLDAGEVSNQAKATGNYTDGAGAPKQVSDVSSSGVGAGDLPTVVEIESEPAIALVKTADTSEMNSPMRIGDEVIYRFAVTNTGNVTLSDVTVTDPLTGLRLSGGPIARLAPGETDSDSYIGRYPLTEADFSRGVVENQATARGLSPLGIAVTDLSGSDIDNDEATALRLALSTGVTATKSASMERVLIGDSVSYTLEFRADAPGALRDLTVVDSLPAGLVYTPGSATVNRIAAEPEVAGRTLRWTGLTLSQAEPLTVRLAVRVTASAAYGELVNRTWLDDATDRTLSNTASARIIREAEHVFECTDIIGKVFDDRNGNGYQDPPPAGSTEAVEPGIPAVRVVTTSGAIVTADEFGRFHVPCAELPRSSGSNFTLKLDTRSLPTGYRVTTENPRTIRVTPGKMAELNFGASLSTVVRIDLSASAFTATDALSETLRSGVVGLAQQMGAAPVVVRLNYRLAGESERRARQRLEAVETALRQAWRGRGGKLLVERTVQRSQ